MTIPIEKLMENINKTFNHINSILNTYDPDDEVINEVKKKVGLLYVAITHKDMEIDNKKCPCKKECEF